MENPAGIKAFGEHLCALRERAGKSQAEVADVANIAKTTLQRIEQGKVSATLDVLIRICRALGISMTELMDCPSLLDADTGPIS
ncbi:helix-turn-helix domain-containing protein [Hymenobacter jejuensis]|uniref:helix-turn-helix domain-containing protein n=1 Tax=Hymenobacter jejuensis TaxID=2502781 RepID=UPI0013FD0F78|nr:helix-turn-helix transcriptional regulator [Hymenobacter jejuensis]